MNLHERVDEMILGLYFTDVVRFDISSHLAKNHERLNGLDFTRLEKVSKDASISKMKVSTF